MRLIDLVRLIYLAQLILLDFANLWDTLLPRRPSLSDRVSSFRLILLIIVETIRINVDPFF